MKNSKGTSSVLLKTIQELNKFKTIQAHSFALGGGTNLAIRYNHRISNDIDLFCPEIIGFAGYAAIEKELIEFYKNDILSITHPAKESDQFVFIRVLLQKENETIKLELIQNIKIISPTEDAHNIKMLSELDVGVMKLLALADRMSKKDVYDLEYITQKINLSDLFNHLKLKQEKYNSPEDKSIFDISDKNNPIKNPELLIKFDSVPGFPHKNKPDHSEDILNIINGNQDWYSAKMSWKLKVRELYKTLGLRYPKIKGKKI